MTIKSIKKIARNKEYHNREVTVRCRIRSTSIAGETDGLDSLYLVEDPKHDVDDRVALSFWTRIKSSIPLRETDPTVLKAVGIEPKEGTEEPSIDVDEKSLTRGEDIIARVIPRVGDHEGQPVLYLNVTTVLIRNPSVKIGKGYLRSSENCPRESYLRYEKRVYGNDPYAFNHFQEQSTLRGDVAHRAAEIGIKQHLERFENEEWTEEQVREFCSNIMDEEYSIRVALLISAGVKISDAKDHATDIVHRLFTDDQFRDVLLSADSVEAERYLDNQFGYNGCVDLIADGVPYDIKTTRQPDGDKVREHAYQLKLYLFVLLLELLEVGESVEDVLRETPTGYILYPNVDDKQIRIEPVELTEADFRRFIADRNSIVTVGETFAPPSTYNRECDGCQYKSAEWITGPDDALSPACTYHCQNERRWPCYETTEHGIKSDCSLFDICEDRTEYRDPDRIHGFERIRSGLQQERTARTNAATILERLDPELLSETGRLVPKLSISGVSGKSIVRYESSSPTVPSFSVGDRVTLRRSGTTEGREAMYYGLENGLYKFQFLDTGGISAEMINPEIEYEAVQTPDIKKVTNQYLPYLDFAQRRGYPVTTRRDATDDISLDGVVTTSDPNAIQSYVDRQQMFVDVPARNDRVSILSDIVEQLVTTELPHPGTEEETIKPENSRVLVLGTTPELADIAQQAQPSGEHYRIDGTKTNERSILASDGSHTVQSRLLGAKSLISTVAYATADWPTKGHTELFHALTDGPFVDDADELPDRSHTEQFFDMVVLLGAEQITTPEYRFLQDVADRVVAVGDRRRTGPQMMSDGAVEADLNVSHFESGFDHFASFPSSQGVSIQFTGHAPPALSLFDDGKDWESVDGSVTFLDVQGIEETEIDTVSLRTTVEAEADEGRRLVFDVTDTTANPFDILDVFSNRESLDHTKFTEESPAVVDGVSLFVRSVELLPASKATQHEVIIRTTVSETKLFSESLLANQATETILTQIVDDDVDYVVTPFRRHATRIRGNLSESGYDSIPVKHPDDLNGNIATNAIVSLPTANEAEIVRPPVTEPEILYGMLSCAQNLTIVGNRKTLQSKDLFRELLASAETYNEAIE